MCYLAVACIGILPWHSGQEEGEGGKAAASGPQLTSPGLILEVQRGAVHWIEFC